MARINKINTVKPLLGLLPHGYILITYNNIC